MAVRVALSRLEIALRGASVCGLSRSRFTLYVRALLSHPPAGRFQHRQDINDSLPVGCGTLGVATLKESLPHLWVYFYQEVGGPL